MKRYTRLGSPTSLARLTISLYVVIEPSPVGNAPASKSSVSAATEPPIILEVLLLVNNCTRSRTRSFLRFVSPISYTRLNPLEPDSCTTSSRSESSLAKATWQCRSCDRTASSVPQYCTRHKSQIAEAFLRDGLAAMQFSITVARMSWSRGASSSRWIESSESMSNSAIVELDLQPAAA